MTLSSVVFRNMSSEPKPQPSPRPAPRRAGNRAPVRPDPARYSAPGAAELAGAAAEGAPAGDEPVMLTEAKAMRALAHPVRMALLELFNFRETLTATQASEALGESPANCAFHLRTLAKYGFVREAGGGRGRERPWALASRRVTLTTDQPDPQAALAADELSRLWFDRWVDRTKRLLGSRNEKPGWEEASGWTGRHVFMTPEESARLRVELGQILDRYEGRRADPALRPEGALPVEWTIFTAPWPEESALDDPGPAAGPEDPDAAGRS
jgi:Helix-turn-helix domain